MKDLMQNQTAEPLLFLMLQSTDHISPAAGLTCTVTLSKNGGAFVSPSGAVTEIANGWYKVAANATDANTLGPLILHATATAADPSDERFEIVAYNAQDAVHLGLSALPNTVCTTNASLLTSGTGTDQLSVTSGRIDIGKALGNAITLDANNVLNVSAKYLAGTAQTGRDIGASVIASDGTLTLVKTVQTTSSMTTLPAITQGTITLTISLMNLPTIPANWLTATGIQSGALNGKGNWPIITANGQSGLDEIGQYYLSNGYLPQVAFVVAGVHTLYDSLFETLNSMIVADQYSSSALANAPSGGLTGPSSVAAHWVDASSASVPLVAFSVRSANNSTLIGPGQADSNGRVTFGSQNGTYTLVSQPTSTVLFSNQTIIVNGNISIIVNGTTIIPPTTDNPLQTRCSIVCYDQQANPLATAKVTFQQLLPGANGSWSNDILICSCDMNGNLLNPPDSTIGVLLARDVTYRAHRGVTSPPTDAGWVTFTPTTTSFLLPAMLGTDSE